MLTRPKQLILAITLLLGLWAVVDYSIYLKREELRSWQQVRVFFPDVGGLEEKDNVQVWGRRVGRVNNIRFYKQGQLVTLDVDPGIQIYDSATIEVVPTSALGFVAVEIRPGDPKSQPLDPATVLEGRIRPVLGSSTAPSDDRQREMEQLVDQLEEFTERMKFPDSSLLGKLVSDPEAAMALDDYLTNLVSLTRGIDEALARVEYGHSLTGFLSQDALVGLNDTVHAFRATLSSLKNSLQRASQGEGTAGLFLSSKGYGKEFRGLVEYHAGFWETIRQGEGFLGSLVESEARVEEWLHREIDRFRQVSAAGVEGEGLLGALSSTEAGEATRQTLAGMEATSRKLRDSALIRGEDARATAQDVFGNAEDFLLNIKGGLNQLRKGLPDRTFHGAVLSVF